MTKRVNEMLAAKTTTEYFKVCTDIAGQLEHINQTASDIFYQLNNIGLIDITFDEYGINFIVEGIARTVEDVTKAISWISNSDPIKIIKNKSTSYIIVKVVL